MVYQGKQFNPDLDPGSEGARRPTSAPRITTPLKVDAVEVDLGRNGTREKVANALSREAGHDEHGAPASASTESETEGGVKGFLSKAKDTAEGLGKWGLEKANEIRSALRELRQVRRAYAKGELTKEMLDEVSDTIFDVLGMEITRGLAPYTLVPLVAWRLGARDHELHKDTPDYSDLSTQILNMHEDEDHPGLYHHATESLCAGMDETHLRKHYSCLTGQNKFRQSYSNPNGRKLLKEQLGKLLGTEVDEIHELTDKIEALAGRMGIHITPPNPAATPPTTVSTFVPHDLQHRHANHSLHFLSNILQLTYNEVTADRLAKIMGPNEDVKLEKDINKIGTTLMESVKGSTDLAEQFLGNWDRNVFDKAYRLLLTPVGLDEGIQDEREEVIKQLYQLFNLSGHVNADELNAFMNGLIGLPPYSGAIPANHNGGALGVRSGLSADAQIKFDELRERMDRARCNLLGITPPTPVGTPTPAEAPNSPRSRLFPAKAEVIKYNEFGAQLGRARRGKQNMVLGRSRDMFLRGYDQGEFTDHFLVLMGSTDIQNALNGSKTDKEALRNTIRELTGLKLPNVTQGQWTNRMDALLECIACNPNGTRMPPPAPPVVNPELPREVAKQTQLGADLYAIKDAVLSVGLDAIFEDDNLEKALGSTLNRTANTGIVDAFNQINTGFLSAHYGSLAGNPPAAPVGAINPTTLRASTPHVTYQRQLSAFLGVPRSYNTWSPNIMQGLLTNLARKATLAITRNGGTHAGATDLLAYIAIFGTWNPTAPGTFTLNTGTFDANFFNWMNAIP